MYLSYSVHILNRLKHIALLCCVLTLTSIMGLGILTHQQNKEILNYEYTLVRQEEAFLALQDDYLALQQDMEIMRAEALEKEKVLEKELEVVSLEMKSTVLEGQGGPTVEEEAMVATTTFEVVEVKDPYEPTFMPCEGNVSSQYGVRQNPFDGTSGDQHSGIDIAAPTGTPIYATAKGTVTDSRYMNGYGYAVFIDHGNGVESRYAHCSKLLVNVGEEVEKGQLIAQVGSTGNSTGPHLHFELRKNGQAMDPKKIFEEE